MQPEYYPAWGTCPSAVRVIENGYADFFNIYPNPSNTSLTIETSSSDPFNIEITSLNGQLIYSGQMEGTIHQLDLSSFQKGIYIITVRSKDFVTTQKVVKH